MTVNEDINIGAITEALNDKMDTDGMNAGNPACVVVESWHDNNGNWYRVYSDGWCEQGGLFPVTSSWNTNNIVFEKPYKDTNYNVLYSNGFINNSGIYGISSKSTTGFTVTIYNGSDAGQGGWEAKGYIS
jgi:hypothetical protein